MARCYLQVEAVNIDAFVFDTNDISTIRGGSYLLLDAIRALTRELHDELHPVATAASRGLFWFEPADADPKQDCQAMERRALKILSEQTAGHATFAVATQIDLPGDFARVLANLDAKIRRQQWRTPTIAIPAADVTSQECYLDGWRPGVTAFTVDENAPDARISRATAFRRDRGRAIKHDLFRELLGADARAADWPSAPDLGVLAQDPAKGNLNGKIAYIHIDGNGFGHLRQTLCQSPEELTAFDDTIQTQCRNVFLRELLTQASADPDFQTHAGANSPALRLEVLLWGGDEMILVVPAWQMFQVVSLFYAAANDLTYKGHPLSYRTAIVQCRHNTPITLVRQLAGDLLARTRKDIVGAADAVLTNPDLGNAMHVLVLETFELAPGKLDRFLTRYYNGVDYGQLLIRASELSRVLTALSVLRQHLPFSRAIAIVKAVGQPDAQKRIDDILDRALALLPSTACIETRAAVTDLTQSGTGRWYLLTDLWDYLTQAEAV